MNNLLANTTVIGLCNHLNNLLANTTVIGFCTEEPEEKPERSYNYHKQSWDNHTIGQTVTYKCNTGYIFTDNSTHHSKNSTGVLSGRLNWK